MVHVIFIPKEKVPLRPGTTLSAYRLRGNSLIGRQLYPLLQESGFSEIKVEPRIVYIDSSKPGLVDGFILKTIIPMVEGVK